MVLTSKLLISRKQSNLYGSNETYEEDDDDDVASRSFASRSYHEQVVYEEQQTPSHIPDATRQVHDVYQQQLTLLPNPDDFAKVVNGSSQLFGVEQTDGIELQTVAWIVQISQLFLRWLALVPCGGNIQYNSLPHFC